MTAATSRLRRRGIGAGVAALVGLSGLGFAAMPAQAAAGFDPAASQVSGVDRFDTAARIATAAFPTGSSTVVVANGDRAIDAQAGAYAAGLNNAPILLTQKSSVPAFTVNAIKTLGATKAIVLGDSNSVDATALAQMTAAGLQVQVVSGTDRFATAAAVYNLGPATKASTVFLARADLLAGQVSPDALAASPLSFDGTPVLLTNAGSLPQATADAIKNGGVKNVVVLGNAITDSVKSAVTALGATVTTLAGDDRSLTAQKIADYGVQQGKYGKTTATIANGDKIDALAAGPWAAKNMAPILLTLGTNALGTGTSSYLTANASTLTKATVFGDANSVPTSLVAAAKTAGGGDITTNATLAITPTDSVLTEFSSTRQYSVTGLTAGTNYRVTLVKSSNVAVDANGRYSFTSTGTPKIVDPGTVASRINVVNGVSVTAAQSVGGIAPSNNGLTFSVATPASTPEAFVPVVYVDGGAVTQLEVDSSNRPTEAFGVGGLTTVLPPNGGIGPASITAGNIVGLSLTGDYVTSATARYTWDSNDVFQYQGVGITQAQFESAISSAQGLSITYNPTASGVSTFNLGAEIAPTAAALATASTYTVGNYDSGTANNDVRAVFAVPAASSAGTVYTLQRKLASAAATEYRTVTTATATADAAAGTITFVDANVAAGTYTYRVVATLPVSGTVVNATDSSNQVVTAPADTTAPKSVYAAVSTQTGLTGSVDASDAFVVAFDRPLTLGASQTLRIRDADGTIFDLVQTGTAATSSATFALNGSATPVNGTSYPAGQVLTVTLTPSGIAPAQVAAGSVAGLQYPATVIDQSGLVTSGGINWDITNSGDVTIS